MVYIWDIATGTVLYKWPGTLVIGNIFSNNNSKIAVRVNKTTVKVYSLTDGSEIWTLAGHKNVAGMTFGPDDVFLAVGDRNDIKHWSMKSGQEIFAQRSSETNGCSVATDKAFASSYDIVGLSRDICNFTKIGWMKAIGYGRGYESAAGGGEGKLEFQGKEMDGMRGQIVEQVALSPRSWIIAGAMSDYSLHLWDAESGKEIMQLYGNDKPVTHLLFSEELNLLVSSSLDGTIQIWGIH
jgi:WD40 repeat protein